MKERKKENKFERHNMVPYLPLRGGAMALGATFLGG